VRLGDVCAAGLVLAGTHVLGFGVSEFAATTAALAALWPALAAVVGRRFHQLAPDPGKQ
jgi:hypothetical protein